MDSSKAIIGSLVIAIGLVAAWGAINKAEALAAKDDYLQREGQVKQLKVQMAKLDKEYRSVQDKAVNQANKVKVLQDKLAHVPKPAPIQEPPKTVEEIASDLRLRWKLDPILQGDTLGFKGPDLPVLHKWGQLQENYPKLEQRNEVLESLSAAQDREIGLLRKETELGRGLSVKKDEVIQQREAQIQDLNNKIKADSRADLSKRAKWIAIAAAAGFVLGKR